MIEIPESINLAKQIDRELSGKKIKNVFANHTPHGFAWYNGNPADYPQLFNGETVTGTDAYGGKLHIKLSGDCDFMFCDGVNIRYYTDGKLPKKHQLLMEFDDSTHLVCTISMYGALLGFKGPYEHGYDDIARIRPQVFSEEFSLDYFLSLLEGLDLSKTTVKAFLATNQRIPGLGNGVLHDILFNASVAPKRKLDTLSRDDFIAIYRSVKSTLAKMIQEGGRDVEKDIYGRPGGYKTILSRLTYKSPCPRCGGEIKREAYLGGNVYYCVDCQK